MCKPRNGRAFVVYSRIGRSTVLPNGRILVLETVNHTEATIGDEASFVHKNKKKEKKKTKTMKKQKQKQKQLKKKKKKFVCTRWGSWVDANMPR